MELRAAEARCDRCSELFNVSVSVFDDTMIINDVSGLIHKNCDDGTRCGGVGFVTLSRLPCEIIRVEVTS